DEIVREARAVLDRAQVLVPSGTAVPDSGATARRGHSVAEIITGAFPARQETRTETPPPPRTTPPPPLARDVVAPAKPVAPPARALPAPPAPARVPAPAQPAAVPVITTSAPVSRAPAERGDWQPAPRPRSDSRETQPVRVASAPAPVVSAPPV